MPSDMESSILLSPVKSGQPVSYYSFSDALNIMSNRGKKPGCSLSRETGKLSLSAARKGDLE